MSPRNSIYLAVEAVQRAMQELKLAQRLLENEVKKEEERNKAKF